MGKISKSMVRKPYITIQNVGPIKDITLPLNRVNVLIGPQSSGKSTIAKLLSFCSWLEKEMIIPDNHCSGGARRNRVHKGNQQNMHGIARSYDSGLRYRDGCV